MKGACKEVIKEQTDREKSNMKEWTTVNLTQNKMNEENRRKKEGNEGRWERGRREKDIKEENARRGKLIARGKSKTRREGEEDVEKQKEMTRQRQKIRERREGEGERGDGSGVGRYADAKRRKEE